MGIESASTWTQHSEQPTLAKHWHPLGLIFCMPGMQGHGNETACKICVSYFLRLRSEALKLHTCSGHAVMVWAWHAWLLSVGEEEKKLCDDA